MRPFHEGDDLMNATQSECSRPVHVPPKSAAELEAEALAWCEKLSRKLDTKRSRAKRRGNYERRG